MRNIQLGLLLVLLACANQPVSENSNALAENASKNLIAMTRNASFKVETDDVSISGALHIHAAMPNSMTAAGEPDMRACVYGRTVSSSHKNYLKSNWQMKFFVDEKPVELQTRKITAVTSFDSSGNVKNDPGVLVIEACSRKEFPAPKSARFELRNSRGRKLTELSWTAPWPSSAALEKQAVLVK